MKIKTKLILNYPRIYKANRKARKIAKKFSRDETGEKFPAKWRSSFALKKVKILAKILNIEIEVEGFDNLPKGSFILAPNHSSLLDPAIILIALEQSDPAIERDNIVPCFLAKDDILKNKKIRGWADTLDTFYLSRENPRAALKTLNEWATFSKDNKRAAVVFPEGTRTKTGEIGNFKSGAFRSAKKMYLPIVPCTINNALSATDLSRTKKIKVKVIFHTQLKPSSFIIGDGKSLAEKVEKIVKSAWIAPDGKRSDLESKIV